jgi:L-serine dehydratase
MRVADVFKIGIGPSSSHTVGPMRAARAFALSLAARESAVARVRVDLFGSLALTGIGHGTDRALVLGLCGYAPDAIDAATAHELPQSVAATGTLRLPAGTAIAFDPARDIAFNRETTLPYHSNGMRFTATLRSDPPIDAEYYSVGGGAVEGPGFTAAAAGADGPYAFSSADELLAIAETTGLAIWELVRANECVADTPAVLERTLAAIWDTMRQCIAHGLATEGILPGGLNVRRRAPRLYRRFQERAAGDHLAAMDYANVIAIAVNEENAAGGRVVTAPTNGAAGIIPAVLSYYDTYVAPAGPATVERFLLTAAAIGMLYKRNASISGAEVGCQGEVGVACSMAAGALVAAHNGTNVQVEHAAEIAMEHNLGMTCDPIGGLVQIPCIERNAIGAVKAINAARMAMSESEHKVSLDQVIEVMYRTGLDMQSKYKETSLGGLAVSVVEC